MADRKEFRPNQFTFILTVPQVSGGIMAKPTVAHEGPIVNVVGDAFCVPFPVELIVKRKYHGLIDARFEVLDMNENLFFQVDGCYRNLQKKRIMRYPAGFPILTMREKVLTLRHRWTVHRGESKEKPDLLFSVQRTRPLQIKTELDIFLGSDVDEGVSDFQVVGCYSSRSCKVYKGDSVIAEMDDKLTVGDFFKGKDNFRVKVYPGVDYAFIVALIVILGENDKI